MKKVRIPFLRDRIRIAGNTQDRWLLEQFSTSRSEKLQCAVAANSYTDEETLFRMFNNTKYSDVKKAIILNENVTEKIVRFAVYEKDISVQIMAIETGKLTADILEDLVRGAFNHNDLVRAKAAESPKVRLAVIKGEYERLDDGYHAHLKECLKKEIEKREGKC